MKKLFAIALIALSFNALADQCAYVTAEQAKTAAALLNFSKENSGDALFLCQNCGESRPTVVKIADVTIKDTGVTDAPAEVQINNSGIDLAYTYVDIGNNMFVNLGKLSNCANDGTSQFILKAANGKGKTKYYPGPKF